MKEIRQRYYWQKNADGTKTKVEYYPVTHKDAVVGLSDALDGKVNRYELDELGTPDLSGYATKTELASKADKTEIPSVSGLATKSEVSELSQEVTQLDSQCGELSELTTTDKTSLVKAINEANSKADGKYSKPSGGIPSTDLDSAVQTSLGKADSALQSHQTLKTINNESIVGEGNITIEGGSGDSSFRLVKTINITDPTYLVEQSLDGGYSELIITSEDAVLVVDSSGNGKQDYLGVIPNEYTNSYRNRVSIGQSVNGNYTRRVYAHIIALKNSLHAYSNLAIAGETTSVLNYGCINFDSAIGKINKIKIMPKTSTNFINTNTLYIYGR